VRQSAPGVFPKSRYFSGHQNNFHGTDGRGLGPGASAVWRKPGPGSVQQENLLADRFSPEKAPRWHLIGHLQTNKVRRAVELFDCIQSVDSLKLAELLAKEGERRAQPVSCLVEVKISNEASKQGMPPDNLAPFWNWRPACPF
jgi:uncharacterized pyridoxal phosphate-containing UPF0001 family protein